MSTQYKSVPEAVESTVRKVIHLPSTLPSVEVIQNILKEAVDAAASLKVGDTFKGAFGEADVRGYIRDQAPFNLFTWQYVNELRRVNLWLNEENVIVRIERK